MAHDLVVRNGLVVDGTGSPGFEADVGIDGGTIAAIGKDLGSGDTEIDARGQVVAPGFIDSHTHMDLFIVQYPHGNPVVNYGVTSIVIGDCGASIAPVPPKGEPRDVLITYLRRVLDDYVEDKDWKWTTFPEYLDYLEGRVGVNVAALVPHSPVRLTVMGEAAYRREATPEELENMKQMVREGMEAGGIGFSSSPRGGPAIHAGTPSTLASQEEMAALANVAGEYGGCFQFNGFGNLLKPESGFPELVEKIHVPMIGNEFRVRPGEKEDGLRAIELMKEARERGKDIYGVVIPYSHIRRFDLDDCFILDGLPLWEEIKQDRDELPRKLRDPEVRRKLDEQRRGNAGEPVYPEWLGWGGVYFDVMQREDLKSREGRNVPEVAGAAGKSEVDAFFDTWLEDGLASKFYYQGFANGHMDLLAEMIKTTEGLIGTDAGAHLDRFFWHGAPTRVLGYWRRDKKLFNLEEAVHKVTGHPAAKLGMNRGRLKTGLPADVTVFDPDKVDDLASKRMPAKLDEAEIHRHPPGIGAVVVNGKVVLQDGECRDVFPGRVRRQDLFMSGQ